MLFYLLIIIFIQIVLGLKQGCCAAPAIGFCSLFLFAFVSKSLRNVMASMTQTMEDMDDFIILRAVIYHGISKLLIGTNRATSVKTFVNEENGVQGWCVFRL